MSKKVSDDVSTQLRSIDKRLKKIESGIVGLKSDEDEILADEQSELEELQKLESLEKKLAANVTKPLANITYRDFTRSAVGAFFGILGHFSFFYGIKISEHISVTRASLLYITAFFVGLLFLYFTGYRKTKKASHGLLFVRLLVIYSTSIFVIFLILFLFDYISFAQGFASIYKTVATISIIAVMGAVTADLLGKEPE